MKLFVTLVVACVVAVNAVPNKHSAAWLEFKAKHGKKYHNATVEDHRFAVFAARKDAIDRHNARFAAGLEHFKMGLNKYADVEHEHFVSTMNGYGAASSTNTTTTTAKPTTTTVKPTTTTAKAVISTSTTVKPTATTTAASVAAASVDWRTKGAVTAVKDQGQCGSCYTFSSTGALEGQNFLKTGKLVSLSEQNLVDCSTAYGNGGCNGGLMANAFEYVAANKGVDTEVSYPYQAVEGTCRYSAANSGGSATGFVSVTATEAALQTAVTNIGPISVAIDASHSSFQNYASGIYYEPACSSTNLDHAVLVVGYGTDSSTGKDYWLVKNSWGTTWGEQGYIRMARNMGNHCGIATDAVYPTV